MIHRDLAALGDRRFDIAIVGGGIHGAAMAFEASRRGLRVALVDKDDFGGGSSNSSLRILHGGLRYLQTLDLPRFRESVAARKIYAARFPQLVRPLPCLMPLYSQGAKRPSIMRIALKLNDLLSADRNTSLAAPVRLPSGQILSRDETLQMFPAVRSERLSGAALWYDYQMWSSERILMELLRTACRNEAVVANYAEATRFIADAGSLQGVVCTDRLSGREFQIRAPLVVNCTGVACNDVAVRAGFNDAVFAPPSVAFNVLFESAPFGTSAMGIAAPEPQSLMHFVCPSRHGLWAGTAHVPRSRGVAHPAAPTDAELAHFVGSLKKAVPAFDWAQSRVRKVFWGVLPVTREQSVDLTVRPEILRHGRDGQRSGLFSVVGIKYTTATRVAEQALRVVFDGKLPPVAVAETASLSGDSEILTDGDLAAALPVPAFSALVERLIREESVIEPDDILLRRTNWMFTAKDTQMLSRRIADALTRTAGLRASMRPVALAEVGERR